MTDGEGEREARRALRANELRRCTRQGRSVGMEGKEPGAAVAVRGRGVGVEPLSRPPRPPPLLGGPSTSRRAARARRKGVVAPEAARCGQRSRPAAP